MSNVQPDDAPPDEALPAEAPPDVEVADLIEAWDLLSDRLEGYMAQLQSEQPAAEQSDDPRYARRVTRGIAWTEELLEVMDDVLERLGSLRHNHQQLKWAREGKMV